MHKDRHFLVSFFWSEARLATGLTGLCSLCNIKLVRFNALNIVYNASYSFIGHDSTLMLFFLLETSNVAYSLKNSSLIAGIVNLGGDCGNGVKAKKALHGILYKLSAKPFLSSHRNPVVSADGDKSLCDQTMQSKMPLLLSARQWAWVEHLHPPLPPQKDPTS